MTKSKMLVAIALLTVALSPAGAGRARAAETEADAEGEGFPPEFVTGDFVVVGREPNGGVAYAGRATIEIAGAAAGSGTAAGRQLRLVRRLEGAAAVAETLVGGIESAAGGDVRVVRFRGPAQAARGRTFTCLVSGDLDNYPRLTCYWTYDAQPDVKEPGLETLFSTGAWPEEDTE